MFFIGTLFIGADDKIAIAILSEVLKIRPGRAPIFKDD
jgi:hypothetical protein